ncbi:glutamate--tRNA ligase [Dongia sedimenti]|uniref:Glutamate--tRNA ligase n=1 Tax=Dongia sedimenti TaxID=3064282 RepID=A0ABU0YTE7_9PROT|nr:glutamate--tRNA ligase [Rhodospirillaceae bacterium R-7]
MSIRVRFAPSPTGRLHVGNIYVALNNWLFAKKQGGKFLLRLDDTDRERSTLAYAAVIEDDLKWLGLVWDEFTRQSDRIDTYEAAAAKLKASGHLYPCYETAEELALQRKVQSSLGKSRVYDRAALKLTDADRQRLEAEGRRPHWRFKLDPRNVEWNDLVRGPQHIDESSQSDPILIREDGTFLYTLPSVVDDVELKVSHVIRGNDHVTNTATQIQIYEALGAKAPTFAHLPLLVDASGEGLSKRLGSLSIMQMREEGLEPMAINAYLARIGTGHAVEAVTGLEALIADHDLSKFGKTSPRFDPEELKHLNARLLHALSFDQVKPQLAALNFAQVDPALWEAARGNLEKIGDIALWQQICRSEIAPVVPDGGFAAKAAELLPGEPWDGDTWKTWTQTVQKTTGKKGKDLFMPLRLALTGLDHGPELKALLPLIGRDRALKRLRGERA